MRRPCLWRWQPHKIGSMTHPTLDDLRLAETDLKTAMARQDAYDGNTPNKHATSVRLAREEVTRLTRTLKAAGLLPRTESETLEVRLDAAFPKAAHKDQVSFEGIKYERWYSPATRSLSGNPMSWDRGWIPIEPPSSSSRPDV